MPEVRAVGTDEREPGDPGDVHDTVAHRPDRRTTGPAVKLSVGGFRASGRLRRYVTELGRRDALLWRRSATRRRGGWRRRCSSTAPRRVQAAKVLGLHSVGDLLEHVPRDRREARARSRPSKPSEAATIVAEVRKISSRPVRRRGGCARWCKATVADHSGSLRVTFFQQPWLVDRYPPGTRLILHGSVRPPQARLHRPGPRAEGPVSR